MKERWREEPFEDCIEKVICTRKIQRKDFLRQGAYPIVSQEAGLVNGYWDDKTDLFKAATPVVVFGDHTKILKYVDFDFVVGADGVKILRPRRFLSPKFFYYQLQTAKLDSLGYARHFRLLTALKIVCPPISEQQRIAGVLDKAFEGIATAKANAEKNLQNARALFESYLQVAFSLGDQRWVDTRKPLADLCMLIVDCEHRTAPTGEQGIPSIRTPNIGRGKLLLDGVYRVSEQTYKTWTRRAEPRAGDLILAREAPAGNIAVVPKDLRLCLGQRTVLIRPRADIFDSQFLALLLLQPQMQRKLLAHSRGATVQHVNMKDIRALVVGAIPPLVIQRSLVATMNNVSAGTQRLESLYRQKLAALDELKQSLLHEAFEGEL